MVSSWNSSDELSNYLLIIWNILSYIRHFWHMTFPPYNCRVSRVGAFEASWIRPNLDLNYLRGAAATSGDMCPARRMLWSMSWFCGRFVLQIQIIQICQRTPTVNPFWPNPPPPKGAPNRWSQRSAGPWLKAGKPLLGHFEWGLIEGI